MASIQKIKGLWRYRVSYKENGIFKTKTKGGFKTKKECELAAADLEHKLQVGFNINKAETPFSEYMRNWFDIYHKGKHNDAKHEKDIERSVTLVEEHFKGIQLKDLTRDHYQRFLNKLGPQYAQETMRKRHLYIKMALQDAVESGIILKNPTYRVIVKGLKPTKSDDLKFLSFDELKKLVAELNSNLTPRYISRYIILFAIATGARFSEILGLTWDCVDFENKTVTINKTWERDKKDFGDTKTFSSKRTITIDSETCMILRRLNQEQKIHAIQTGIRNTNNLVFVNTKMEMVTNAAVNKTLRSLCKKINIKEVTCHCLRHTHASMLLFKGVNVKYISKRLGHKDITTTLQTYSHIIDEMEQKESRQIDATMHELFG